MRLDSRLLIPIAALALCGLACGRSKSAKGAVAAPGSMLQGKVLEVLPAPPYTYVRLEAAGGEAWAAIPAADVKPGSRISVQVQLHQDTFDSPSLHRSFKNLYMGTVPGLAPAPMAAQPAPAPLPDVKVEKAQGGDAHTVAELYAQKDKLKDKPVAVKGKIVKYSEGILGKTWIHLRDGSGTQAGRDFDLAVTTKDAAKLGDVVTVKGALHLNRDFGTGYAYPLIVEDAKLVK